MSTDQQQAIIEFADGLPGFEDSHQFVLISGPATAPFTIVQGVGPTGPSFAAIDPLHVTGGYRADLQESDRARLGADGADDLLWLALICPRPGLEPTVNLRAPLVINPRTLRGIQLITTESPYRIDHPLRAA
jgi:flagellar assembly factor FliW